MDDHQLLHEFAANRSESAFRTLTDRHLNLVYSTALRRVGGDISLAQDVSQAVFILLARKADRLSANAILAGWLYRTTQFVAGRALRGKIRRERHEQEAFQMQEHTASDSNWQQLAPLLDEALGRLKDTDRNAILLRYFEDHSLLKVGLALGVSEAAAGKRVARALESLRDFFGRRGFTITASALAASLTQGTSTAAPATVGQGIVNSVFAHAPASSSPHYLLVQETLKAWQWARIQWIAGLSLVLVTAALVAVSVPRKAPASLTNPPKEIVAPQPALVAAAQAPEVPPTPSAAPSAALVQTNVLKFQAVDAVTGKGLSGAKVLAVVAEDQEHIQHFTNLITDAGGFCLVPRPSKDMAMIAVGVLAGGYEERCIVGGGPYPLPNPYVLKLPRGVKIGGVIQDESGQPVAGAAIQVQFSGTGDSSDQEYQRERPGFPDDYTVATTDASGQWIFASAPASVDSFYIDVKHPAYPAMSFHSDDDARNYTEKVGRFKLAELLSGTAVFALNGGLALHGFVTDEQSQPVADARVSFGSFDDPDNPSTHTGPDGSFTLRPLPGGDGFVTVTAKGCAPEREAVKVTEKSPGLSIQLKAAARLRLRVVDESGNPVPHVDVRLQAWRGYNTLDWGGFTGPDGRIEWDSAPHDQVNIYAGKEAYFNSRDNLLTADGEEQVITLHPQVTVTGLVTDATTGNPIAHFKAIPGSDRLMLANGTNGEYSLTFQEYRRPLEVHFEADGYETATSEPLSPKTNHQVCNLSLKPADPAEAVQGLVLLPDGSPAADAQVALCTAQKVAQLGEGRFMERQASIITNTDASGHFAFPAVQTPQAVVAVHDQGFAQVTLTSGNSNVTVPLQPWGRVEGVLKLHSQQNANRSIQLMSTMIRGSHESFRMDRSAKTDAQGNFTFEKLPPGDFSAYLVPGMSLPLSHQTPVQVTPSQTIQVQIGGTGATVTGQFIQSALAYSIDWSKQTRDCNLHTPNQTPPMPPGLDSQARAKWREAFWTSDAGMALDRAARNYPVNVEPDGKFSVEDVPPGTYELTATLLSQPVETQDIRVTMRTPALGSVRREVVVTDSADPLGSGSLDLGTVSIQTFLSSGRKSQQ